MQFKTLQVNPEDDNLIVWDERFAIGVPVIDGEHKHLVELCNSLYKAVMSGDASNRIVSVRHAIKECADYVHTHFAHEEALLEACGYPGYKEHKKIHLEFTKKVVEMVQGLEFENFNSSLNFAKFLYDWILTHIAHVDTQYLNYLVPYLQKQGA